MLTFSKPAIEDKEWVDECFKYVNSFNCEYTFGNLFVWATAYRTQIARYENFIICRWGKAPDYKYSLPIGKGNFKKAVEEIISDAKFFGIKPIIYGVTSYYKNLLDEYFPDKFDYTYDDGDFDYIYSVEKMASLSGKKYHGKRNHITNFKKNYPDWSFLTAFENYDKLGFVGGILKVDGKAIAYTMGERHSEELFVTHFEKAPPEIQGAYPIINQEFTKNCLMDYQFVNREEDLGIEGLRKAKQSYNPEILLKKGAAAYNG